MWVVSKNESNCLSENKLASDFERVSTVCALVAHKNAKRLVTPSDHDLVALAMRFKKNSQPDK